MDPSDLYREVVIAHNRAPRRFAPVAAPTHAGRCANPLCGDDLAVQLRVVDGRIEALGFAGEGCAVAIAAASMLGDQLAGADIACVAALRADFADLLAGEAAAPRLGELQALSGLRAHPARHQCAWLAFEAVEGALSEDTE